MASRGDTIRCTHNGTGGTGNLTLSAQTGWALPSYVFGSSNSITMEYSIIQWTDSTKTVPSQIETGVGTVTLSTNVLARTQVQSTWNGSSTYIPAYGTAPTLTALNISNTAANVDVICGPASKQGALAIPFKSGAVTNVADGIGLSILAPIAVANASFTFTSGTIYYFAGWITHTGPFSQAATRINTATTGGTPTLSVAIYENNSSGLPGRKLIDFGSLGSTTTAAAIIQNTALATPIDIGLGMFWIAVLVVANGTTGSAAVPAQSPMNSPAGTYTSAPSRMLAALTLPSQTAFSDPATAPTGYNNSTSLYVPLVTFL